MNGQFGDEDPFIGSVSSGCKHVGTSGSLSFFRNDVSHSIARQDAIFIHYEIFI